ncbi:hypothetical protein IQ06DRAFT_349061 [Phaeosphaeriaceae sp. SRC1lsM3a]|nr:hypothetical protein IQ06DRAFT_349061 [Stagonospora sp. SRC1lsM3a]
MAVYYHYDEHGALQSTSTVDPLLDQPNNRIDVNRYLEQGDTVGAYLAQRNMVYPDQVRPDPYYREVTSNDRAKELDMDAHQNQHPNALRHHVEQQNESYAWEGSSHSNLSHMPMNITAAPQHTHYFRYPNPDRVRHLHTLYSLLPHLYPMSRFQSLSGPRLDIVEEGTGHVLYRDVAKKMLVLFLGRKTIDRYLVTRFGVLQLVIPQGTSSNSAWSILMSWMRRATLPSYQYDMEQFKIPHNTFAACTLAQTLSILGLYKDAYRVDMTIAEQHFVRPVYGVELEALWKNLGPKNRYTRAAIKAVKQQLDENSVVRRIPWLYGDIMKLVELHPEMKAAILDNDSEDRRINPVAEKDMVREQSDTSTTAKLSDRAKKLHIVADSKNWIESGEGQDTKGAAVSGEDMVGRI